MFQFSLVKNHYLNPEVVHFYDSKKKSVILSQGNKFYIRYKKNEYFFRISTGWFFFLQFRILRRLFRLDKSNVIFNYNKNGIIVIYQRYIYFYCLNKKKIKKISKLKNHRNVLHNSIAVTKKAIFFGEYGPNPNRQKVPVWASYDDGRNWKIIYNFPKNSIKHIHGIYNDKYKNDLWITVGDFKGECFLFRVVRKNFSKIYKYGDGSQKWRAVSLFFKKNYIIWGMDSPLQTSKLQIFNRKTKQIKSGRSFPGPVWYSKIFSDQSAILQTSVEIGGGVKSNYSILFYSKNLINWHKIAKFKKDILPMKLFKFGVINFSDGNQTPKDFMFSAEGLKNLDGKVFSAKI
jgi:hypothetical protein